MSYTDEEWLQLDTWFEEMRSEGHLDRVQARLDLLDPSDPFTSYQRGRFFGSERYALSDFSVFSIKP
ncbi:MAG: hypothetical protein JOZ48_17620 [Acidobacteriaceae bacterium]|nr:hypothetical protein [Acidobacteriaceae bacterium]